MSKELKAILESELLTDDVKASLKEAVEGLKISIEENVRNDLEVEYAKKFVDQKSEIVESLTTLVKETVEADITELKEDITKYKDLDVQYAQKLEQFKEDYKEQLDEAFNGFVAETVSDEISELRDDLMEAKKLQFGKDIFEAYEATFNQFGIGVDMKELQDQLDVSKQELKESKDELSGIQRDTKINELLESLSGSKREVMKTILEGVSFDKLENRFNETIDSVIKDSDKEVIKESDKDGVTVIPAKDSDNQAELDHYRRLIK